MRSFVAVVVLRGVCAGLAGAVVCGSAFATETRTRTLRDTRGVYDETDAFTYPGVVADTNIALIELGTAADTDVYGGAFKKLGASSAGAVVSRDDSVMTNVSAGGPSLVNDWLAQTASNTDAKAILPAPERPIDLFWATGTGGGALGFRLTTATYKRDDKKTDGPTDQTKRNATQVDLGVGYSTGKGDQGRTDVGLGLGLAGDLKQEKDTPTSDTKYTYKRGPELAVSVRWIGRGDTGRPYAEAQLGTRSPKVTADNGNADESGKFKENAVAAEGGYVLVPTKGALVAMAGGLIYFDSKGPVIVSNTGIGSAGNTPATPSILASDDEVKKTTTLLFAKLAVEAGVTESMGILGGLDYALYGTEKTQDDFNAGKPKTEKSIDQTPDATLWALGLFYKAGAFRADASYSKQFLHHGPYFVSGDVTKDLFGRISMSYAL